MRFQADFDLLLHLARRRIENINNIIEAAGEPEIFSVGADVAHVGAAAAGDGPVRFDFARREVDDGYAAWAAFRSVDFGGTAVGDVEFLAVAARIEAVGADAGFDVTDLFEALPIHHENAVRHHVGDEEGGAVGRDADVLRHLPFR